MAGISSEKSDAVVDALGGVDTFGECDLTGVEGMGGIVTKISSHVFWRQLMMNHGHRGERGTRRRRWRVEVGQ